MKILTVDRSAATFAPLLGSGKLATLIQAGQLAHTAYGHLVSYRQRQLADRSYVISVEDDDAIYADLHEWLLAGMSEHEQKNLVAWTDRSGLFSIHPEDDEGSVDARATPKVRYRYNGRVAQRIVLDGHKISVWVDREHDEDPEATRSKTRLPMSIFFQADSPAGKAAVQRLLARAAARTREREGSRVFTASRYGNWMRTRQVVTRSPSTVVLAAGQMERLEADIERFLAHEQQMARLGLPWHRGYLLAGPAGTGKTSCVKALATRFDFDIYLLSLPEISTDTDLGALFTNVPPRSILLLEDIDGGKAAISREDESGRVSTTGLLNALDGVATPHGLIVFMTTNYPERLDPALVRSGRCDVTEEIGYLTDEQMVRLVERMTGRAIPLPALGDRQVPPSDLIEIVKRNIDDMDAARAAIIDYLQGDDGSFADWQAAA